MLFSISRGINPEALKKIGPNQLFMVKYAMITSCYYIVISLILVTAKEVTEDIFLKVRSSPFYNKDNSTEKAQWVGVGVGLLPIDTKYRCPEFFLFE